KKAGVQNADDYQRKYNDCKTDACRQQVKKDYIEASEQASKIILDLYRSGELTTEESMILLTSYASKMMQGAGESQDGWSTPIFNMDAQKWTPSGVIANPDFQQITLSNLVQKMRQSGASEQQIAMRVLQYQIAGQAIGSYSMAEQVDALYNSGLSVNTVITALTLKRGKALSVNEIKAITTRYNQNAGRLVTPNGQVIKNTEHQSTASESRGATQSGGKGKVEGAHKTEQVAGKDAGKGTSSEIKNTYNSIKDSPQYPQAFKAIQNGTTRNAVKNQALLEQLREIEPGKWTKVYKDGFDASGKKVSIHYFQSQSGKVFNVKVKPNWSNIK
ncbi:hypothetical protein BHC59_00390, partial [Snodgrassella alvi]